MSASTRSVYIPSTASPFGTFDPGNATVENGVQRRNSSFVPRITLPVTNSAEPKSSSRPKSAKFTSARIRSNSGLAHHLQALDLKQYTEYLPDGSPKSPMYGLSGSSSHSLTDTSTESVHLTPSFVQTVSESEVPIQDILGKEALDLAMKNPDTANKLWRLAASQGCEDKVEFLMKVRE
jgi:phototropin